MENQFRKKSGEIVEAIQYKGHSLDEVKRVSRFGGSFVGFMGKELRVYTVNGSQAVNTNDWIVNDEQLGWYSVSNEVFVLQHEGIG